MRLYTAMAGSIHPHTVYLLAGLFHKAFYCLFDRIIVEETHMQRLKKAVQTAPGPVMLLPTHRSYMVSNKRLGLCPSVLLLAPVCLVVCLLEVYVSMSTTCLYTCTKISFFVVLWLPQDFLLISYVCFTYGIALPFIAADEAFGSMTVANQMVRRAGAFFVSRGGGKGRGERSEKILMQRLRWMLLKHYITCIAKRYGVLEVFLEGGRSKTGAIAYGALCV